MSVRPPPINEPWVLDRLGRLASPAWIQWINDLASLGQVEETFGGVLFYQTTGTNTSALDVDTDDLFTLATAEAATSDTRNPLDDLYTLITVEAATSGTRNPLDDVELLAMNPTIAAAPISTTAGDDPLLFAWLSF